MARTSKKQNAELLQQAYYAVISNYGLDNTLSTNDQVHCIIEWADELQTEICAKADYIKIEAYNVVKESWPELGIPKTVWQELVHLRRLQRHTTLSDDFIAKVALTFEGAKNVTALRSTLLEAIKNNALDSVQVPTCETEKTLQFDSTADLSEEFVELLNECADVRHEIDSQLWTKMRILGDAFCHLTKEPYGTFKHLLDLWHYRHGGWPKETTPPRIWSTIARFINEYDMLERYGFDMASSWCARLGLQTTRTMQSPTAFTFTKQGAKFGQYFMAKLKSDTEANYPQYPFKPWHHLICNGDYGFAYVWDTRNIEFTFDPKALNLSDLTTDYKDSCEPLEAEDAAIMELAKQCIPVAVEPIIAEQIVKHKHDGREVIDFADAVAKRKAELASNFSIVDTDDALQKYDKQHADAETGFSEDYAVQWKNGDLCFNEFLGHGRVTGANEETGELLVHYTAIDKVMPAWMWHLTKID